MHTDPLWILSHCGCVQAANRTREWTSIRDRYSSMLFLSSLCRERANYWVGAVEKHWWLNIVHAHRGGEGGGGEKEKKRGVRCACHLCEMIEMALEKCRPSVWEVGEIMHESRNEVQSRRSSVMPIANQQHFGSSSSSLQWERTYASLLAREWNFIDPWSCMLHGHTREWGNKRVCT